jgi:hypothetical protein
LLSEKKVAEEAENAMRQHIKGLMLDVDKY